MKIKDLQPGDYHIYVDLDGVLADLFKKMHEVTGHHLINQEDDRTHAEDQAAWNKFHDLIKAGESLFSEFDLMPDAHDLWEYVKPYKPNILTATGRWNPEQVDKQKREWVKKHFTGYDKIYTVMASRQKAKFAWPDAILIDDRMKSITPWTEKGGVGVLHTSAENTIKELKKLGL